MTFVKALPGPPRPLTRAASCGADAPACVNLLPSLAGFRLRKPSFRLRAALSHRRRESAGDLRSARKRLLRGHVRLHRSPDLVRREPCLTQSVSGGFPGPGRSTPAARDADMRDPPFGRHGRERPAAEPGVRGPAAALRKEPGPVQRQRSAGTRSPVDAAGCRTVSLAPLPSVAAIRQRSRTSDRAHVSRRANDAVRRAGAALT